MAQMPEELRHLHQRSCPSASQNDKRPHMWQRCPGKRRLGNQPAIPCYSDCTVQYIIDCNLSLHTADDDTPDRLHCGTNTSNVTSSSPPSKRPRIDMTSPMVPSSPQCAVSDKPPVQHTESSISAHTGPLLPPRTLSSYPVYKLTNMKGSDNVEKPRPLSYRWLVGHCAEHIHAKPSIVERYVERLELLHIVPRNLHDYSERNVRLGLIRRCFKSDAKDRSTANDTPDRSRRRSVLSFPRKKLM